jgi:nicotinamidase-related amidase
MDRHPHLLDRAKAVLVLVDVQERLFAEVVRQAAVEANLLKLSEAARVLGVPVVVTEHAAKAFGPTLPSLRASLDRYAPLHKIVFSCFGSGEFVAALAALGRPQLLLAGLETHVCVCQTALDAVARGYDVHVARDASSARAEESHAVGLEKMAGAGVIPASTETAIFELLGRAGTDEFRKLLPLLKQKAAP